MCIAACLFLSCGQTSNKADVDTKTRAKEVAQTFLTAYLQLDFDETLPLCGRTLQADLELSAQRVRALTPDMQETLKKDLKAYSFVVNDIDLNPSKDSAFVSYIVITPEAPGGLPGNLTMAIEEQEWKVVKLL
jgi:hypothetical protein